MSTTSGSRRPGASRQFERPASCTPGKMKEKLDVGIRGQAANQLRTPLDPRRDLLMMILCPGSPPQLSGNE